ncbi:hypothetical protein HG536_0D02320 [Torulaspora globosa]|uniref:ABC transporter domain-containing protein n=1 Tax=Torulaspora globosa TaxID=48254 RepID=A0A7G3ZGS4_9SACH|nr:uncharacterized protein HG536_0D02320 [Torulaspora globosa]QLL32710.1 hypothetical protein HG536_0D02320 [Torulaspora globosa]
MLADGLVVRISDALFKSSLAKNAKPVFPQKIAKFEIKFGEKWAIWGGGKGQFLDVLANKYLCDPPLSLQYGRTQGSAPHVELMAFKGVIPTAHLSARYEHFKDEFDQTCKKFILDNAIGSNAVSYDVSTTDRKVDMALYDKLVDELKLTDLQDRWAMGLSNGQMRRARLAYSLLKEPDMLLIDDPFLGLDSTAASIISKFLANYQSKRRCSVTIGLRIQDAIPQWCTHVCCVDEREGIVFQGPTHELQDQINSMRKRYELEARKHNSSSRYQVEDLVASHPMFRKPQHEVLKMPSTIELRGLEVKYKGVPVLQDLHWDVKPGSKWHIRGDNGSGKSTLLSLITAEHPQSWNSKVIEQGQPRKTGSSNYFDINRRIGMSSPEIHAIVLKNAARDLDIREMISTGFHDASSNNFKPMWTRLSDDKKLLVEMYIKHFNLQELAQTERFSQLNVSNQKLVLFIRSLIKMPQVLILDEAFSGMERGAMMRSHEVLEAWPGTVLVVSHVEEETPKCDHYLRLLAPGNYKVGQISHDET